MAFTGVAVIAQVSDSVARITGVSLAPGAAGTIGLFGSGADVELPRALNWGPYRDIDLAEAVEVIITPEIPLTVAKTAGPFLCTITNDSAAALGVQQIAGKMYGPAAAQTIQAATPTVVEFGTEAFDTSAAGTMVDVVGNQFTAPVAGIYQVHVGVEWDGVALQDGVRTVTVFVNGVATDDRCKTYAEGGDPVTTQVTTLLELAAGDDVTFIVEHDEPVPIEIIGNLTFATISILSPSEAGPADTGDLEIYLRYH